MKKIIVLIAILIIPRLAIAGWPGDCTFVRIKPSENLVYKGSTSINWKYTISPTNGSIVLNAGVISYSGSYYSSMVESWYYDGGWIKKAYGPCTVTPNNGNLDFEYTVTDTLPEGCPLCVDEKEAAITVCGGEELTDLTNWSDETCSGAICIDPCQDEKDEAISECGSTQLTNFDNWSQETCSGHECRLCSEVERIKFINSCPGGSVTAVWDMDTCKGYCKETGECTSEQTEAARIACGAKGVKSMDASDPNCPYECNTNCSEAYVNAQRACGSYGIGSFNYETCDYSCDECPVKIKACQNSCIDKGGIGHVDCAMSSNGVAVTTCVCGGDLPDGDEDSFGTDPNGGVTDIAPTDKDETTEKNDGPSTDPTSTPSTDTDLWLQAIKKNQDSQLNIDNDIRKANEKSLANLSNIDSNIKSQLLVLNNIAQNINTIANNTADDANRNDLLATSGDVYSAANQIVSAINGLASQMNANDDSNDEYKTANSNDIPNTNTYDSSIDDLPEQDELTTVINDYVNSAPITSEISSSEIQLSDKTSIVDFGNLPVGSKVISAQYDFGQYNDIWVAMGVIMVALSYVSSFFIITIKQKS